MTDFIGMFTGISHMAAWLGLGSAGVLGFLVLAYFFPRYAFHALIAAVLVGSATFIYGKGAYDDYLLQRHRQDEAAKAALDKFAKDRAAAEGAVHDQRAKQLAKPSERVRDVYDRDQSAKPVPNPKAGVRPVATTNVFRK